MISRSRLLLLALLALPLAAPAQTPPAAAHSGTEANPGEESPGLQIMRAIEAARDQPFLEPEGDLKAMLLQQNPELAAPDCGVRYKPLQQRDGVVTLLVAAQGRCAITPGKPAQWVLQIGSERKKP